MKKRSDLSGIPGDLQGKTCLVTGANSGLGKIIALEMARRGARVIMACRRDVTDVRDDLREQSGNPGVTLHRLDLADLASVKQLCDGLAADGERLDLAYLNAGMAGGGNTLSRDGYTLLWQVNFLSNALLSWRLLRDGVISNSVFGGEQAKRQPGYPRIVYTASSRHREPFSIDFEHFGILPAHGVRDTFKMYGLSKLTLMTYAWQLGQRLVRDGQPEVGVFAFCPGSFRSGIGADLGAIGNLVMSTRPTSPQAAAWPAILLGVSGEFDGKTLLYYHKRRQEDPDPRVWDQQVGERLWQETQAIIEKC